MELEEALLRTVICETENYFIPQYYDVNESRWKFFTKKTFLFNLSFKIKFHKGHDFFTANTAENDCKKFLDNLHARPNDIIALFGMNKVKTYPK